jgi:hypothetical protein
MPAAQQQQMRDKLEGAAKVRRESLAVERRASQIAADDAAGIAAAGTPVLRKASRSSF